MRVPSKNTHEVTTNLLGIFSKVITQRSAARKEFLKDSNKRKKKNYSQERNFCVSHLGK